MLAKCAEIKRLVAVRIDSGEDILKTIARAVGENGIKTGVILNGIGSASRYRVHVVETTNLPPGNVFFEGEGAYDILQITGFVIDGRVHAHITLSDTEDALGGHLEEGYFDGSCLLRFILARFGYSLAADRADPAVRTPLCFVSRLNNAFYFSGHAPDTTVKSRFRFPFGAPLLQGMETRLEDGYSSYYMGRSLHAECRVFVDQRAGRSTSSRPARPEPPPRRASVEVHPLGRGRAGGTVSCHELARRSTALTRRIKVTGLERATVRFFLEADEKDRTVYVTRATAWPSETKDEKVPYELSSDGLQLVARDVSGGIVISW